MRKRLTICTTLTQSSHISSTITNIIAFDKFQPVPRVSTWLRGGKARLIWARRSPFMPRCPVAIEPWKDGADGQKGPKARFRYKLPLLDAWQGF